MPLSLRPSRCRSPDACSCFVLEERLREAGSSSRAVVPGVVVCLGSEQSRVRLRRPIAHGVKESMGLGRGVGLAGAFPPPPSRGRVEGGVIPVTVAPASASLAFTRLVETPALCLFSARGAVARPMPAGASRGPGWACSVQQAAEHVGDGLGSGVRGSARATSGRWCGYSPPSVLRIVGGGG